MPLAQKHLPSSAPMENTICSTVKNVGSPTVDSRTYTPCLQKWTEINSPHSLLKEEQKVLLKGRKSIKWESKDLPRFSCISRIVKYLLKIYWAKLERDIAWHSTFSTSAV